MYEFYYGAPGVSALAYFGYFNDLFPFLLRMTVLPSHTWLDIISLYHITLSFSFVSEWRLGFCPLPVDSEHYSNNHCRS